MAQEGYQLLKMKVEEPWAATGVQPVRFPINSWSTFAMFACVSCVGWPWQPKPSCAQREVWKGQGCTDVSEHKGFRIRPLFTRPGIRELEIACDGKQEPFV